MSKEYKCLNNQKFEYLNYSIVPIRDEDKYLIMNWRNEQIYHLRQNIPLTKSDQDSYFKNVIPGIFEQKEPNQLLFSFLKDDICIGYGGLVHINWIDKNAEISFIIKTELEAGYFEKYWSIYLKLIERVAFEQIKMHKIYVYAFDLRPRLYPMLLDNKYTLSAILRDHVFYKNEFLDVVIHHKINEH
jgi:RimJ/RimL family protein N-acetyltransferase